MNPSESFEKIVRACQATNDYMPAWEKFVNAEFFIAVLPQDTGVQTSDFHFALHNSPNGEPTVIVAEALADLKSSATDKAIKMRGANLITTLNPEVSILVALSDGAFGIPKNLVAWLRDSIQPA